MNYNTCEAQKELIRRIGSGDEEASELLYNQVKKLIFLSAKTVYRAGYCSFEDVFQDGVMGYLNAVKNYDLSSEVKFTSYARKAILNSCYTGVSNTSTLSYKSKMRRDRYIKLQQQGLSDNEIMEKLGISDKALKNIKFTPHERMASLNSTISSPDEDTLTLEDEIESEDIGIEEEMICSESYKLLREGIDGLSDIEKEVLLCGGAFGAPLQTRKEIRKKYGICNVKFNNIRALAIRKLKFFAAKNGLEYSDFQRK